MQTQFISQETNLLSRLPAIIRPYQLPNSKKATTQIINTLLPFLAMWALAYYLIDYSIWLSVPVFLVNGFFLGRIFILQHDCGHQSFTPSKRANNIIGNTFAMLTALPYTYWSSSHSFHHGHNGLLWEHRDIGDMPMLTVSEFRSKKWTIRILYMTVRNAFILFTILPMVYILINNRFPLIWMKSFAKARRSLIGSTLLLAAFYVAIWYFFGWKGVIVQAVHVWLFAIYAFWFFYVQHQHEYTYKQWKDRWDYVEAAIKGSSFYKLPKALNWLTGSIGYHHIHHLNPLVPNYELVRCVKENPVLEQVANILTLKESFRCVFNKLWDEEKQKMISFREYFRTYGLKVARV